MSIATEIQRLQTAKDDITRALQRVGYYIPSGLTLDEYGQYIEPYTSGHTLNWMDNPDNYLRFKFITDGSVSWRNYRGDIQYSKNGGSTWTTFNGTTVSCDEGDEIWFKGALTNGSGYYNSGTSCYFITKGKFYANGNVQSLSNFDNTLVNYHFAFLFCQCDGLNVENSDSLVLPATALTQCCYQGMFSNCTSLITSPKLPASAVTNYSYAYMFQGCTKLITSQELTATTLGPYCYHKMFSGCTSLTQVPSILPATTLANNCYSYMFANCVLLDEVPSLPATTLAQSCYDCMFLGCTSLTSAPELPATTLAQSCYQSMFAGCASLTTAPELPATALTNYCYNAMFSACTSLTTAPELPANTLVFACYQNMFYNCSSLNYIKCIATDISASYCTYNWVRNVAIYGTFVKHIEMNAWDASSYNGIPSNWYVEDFNPYSVKELTFNIISSGTIYWRAVNTAQTRTIEYSKNGGNWTSITSTTGGTSFSVSAGDIVKFRGNNANYANGEYCNYFSGSTAKFSVEGNIMSLIDSTGFTSVTTLISGDTFFRLFQNCTGLTSAENLLLPATTLAYNCYYAMFYNCSSLTTAPALHATTLANSCYLGMFQGCTSLTTAPALPATTLVNRCYAWMFVGCTKLNYIKCLATDISATQCTEGWVQNVASTGTFVKNPNMSSWTTGYSGIPSSWIVPANVLYIDDFPEDMMIDEAGSVDSWLDNYFDNDMPGVNDFYIEDGYFMFNGTRYLLYAYDTSDGHKQTFMYGLVPMSKASVSTLKPESIYYDYSNYENNYSPFDYILHNDFSLHYDVGNNPEAYVLVMAE